MPQHVIPVDGNRDDDVIDAAKKFMTSPSFADSFMQQATEAMNAPRETMPPPPRGNRFADVSEMSDRDILAGMLTGEGGNAVDMGYIANVVQNRVNSPRFPNNVRDVVLQPAQFSALNAVTGYMDGLGANDNWRRPTPDAYSLADALLSGKLPDQTEGATHYFRPDIAKPAWDDGSFRAMPMSKHIFGIVD